MNPALDKLLDELAECRMDSPHYGDLDRARATALLERFLSTLQKRALTAEFLEVHADALRQQLAAEKARASELESQVYMRIDKVRVRQCERREVWIWQGDEYDHPESLTCPVIVPADQVRSWIAEKARADELEKKLAPLVEDAARLDALEAHPLPAEYYGGSNDGRNIKAWAISCDPKWTLRQAIDLVYRDAQRKAQP